LSASAAATGGPCGARRSAAAACPGGSSAAPGSDASAAGSSNRSSAVSASAANSPCSPAAPAGAPRVAPGRRQRNLDIFARHRTSAVARARQQQQLGQRRLGARGGVAGLKAAAPRLRRGRRAMRAGRAAARLLALAVHVPVVAAWGVLALRRGGGRGERGRGGGPKVQRRIRKRPAAQRPAGEQRQPARVERRIPSGTDAGTAKRGQDVRRAPGAHAGSDGWAAAAARAAAARNASAPSAASSAAQPPAAASSYASIALAPAVVRRPRAGLKVRRWRGRLLGAALAGAPQLRLPGRRRRRLRRARLRGARGGGALGLAGRRQRVRPRRAPSLLLRLGALGRLLVGDARQRPLLALCARADEPA